MTSLPFLALSLAVTLLGTSIIRPKIRPAMAVPYPYMEDLKAKAPKIDAGLFPDGMLRDYTSTQRHQTASPGYDVTLPATTTPKDLDKLLGGVLKGHGKTIIKTAKRYKLSPTFLAALCAHESANGTSAYARQCNNVSGQLTYSKSAKKWVPIPFPSVEACLERTAKNLHDNYTTQGRVTITQIQKKFCPIITDKTNKGFNDPKNVNRHWTSGLVRWLTRFEAV